MYIQGKNLTPYSKENAIVNARSLFLGVVYFRLRCVFIAVCRLLQLQRAGATLGSSAQASHCGGFFRCRAWTLGARALVVAALMLSSCSLQALEQGLSSAALGLSCSTTCGVFQDIGIPRYRNQTYVPCIGRQILNLWDHQGSPRLLLRFQFLEHTSVPSLLIHNSEFTFCFLVIFFYYRIVVVLKLIHVKELFPT